MSAPEAKTKKFGAGERKIPHHSEKASKYYPAEDDKQKKTVSLTELKKYQTINPLMMYLTHYTNFFLNFCRSARAFDPLSCENHSHPEPFSYSWQAASEASVSSFSTP